MNCPQYGRENWSVAGLCDGCGHSLGDIQPLATAVPKPPARLHRLSVISLVLGLTALVLSFYLFGSFMGDICRYRFIWANIAVHGLLIALPALICGHIAWFLVKRSQGTLWGKRFAAAGVFLGALFSIFNCFWLAMCSPSFHHWRTLLGGCMINMRMIDAACHKYAKNHEGRYPDKLSQLYPKYLDFDNPKTLSCPGNMPVPYIVKDIDNITSYVYYPGATVTDPPKKIVLQDKPDNHWYNGINVLHVDGTLTWEPIDRKNILPVQK